MYMLGFTMFHNQFTIWCCLNKMDLPAMMFKNSLGPSPSSHPPGCPQGVGRRYPCCHHSQVEEWVPSQASAYQNKMNQHEIVTWCLDDFLVLPVLIYIKTSHSESGCGSVNPRSSSSPQGTDLFNLHWLCLKTGAFHLENSYGNPPWPHPKGKSMNAMLDYP